MFRLRPTNYDDDEYEDDDDDYGDYDDDNKYVQNVGIKRYSQ